MKKILLLGGSAQQVAAIDTAKRLGYYTVLCDYLEDNPGQYHADKVYFTSTTDINAVLEIAKREEISGILAYASDPAAPTAAYIAEKLSLPGNPYESVKILCNKDLFRKFLTEHGYNAPKAKGYASEKEAMAEVGTYQFPIIIKPVDSSGSKGVTILNSPQGINAALSFAFSFSRSHRIIIEKYIEKKHPYLIGGDVFVIEGRVVLWGLMNCHRDSSVNTLVPVGKSYPPQLCESDLSKVKETLQKLVTDLHIKNGALNVELIIDEEDEVWLIDVGPRSGGNMIPELLGYIFDVDIPELCVKTAIGLADIPHVKKENLFLATHNLHSSKNGIFQGVVFSPEVERHIFKKCIYKKQGDVVEYFDNASKALGIIFMRFQDIQEMDEINSAKRPGG